MTICQLCKKNPATIHLTEIKTQNGVTNKKELHFCQACAAAKGLAMTATSLPHLLGQAVKKSKQPQRRKEREEELTCPRCGLTWTQFIKRGRLGCPHDYEAFNTRLERMALDQLAPHCAPGGPFHTGKKAGPRTEEDQREIEIRMLEKRLKLLVAEENYEEAAVTKARLDELRGAAAAQ